MSGRFGTGRVRYVTLPRSLRRSLLLVARFVFSIASTLILSDLISLWSRGLVTSEKLLLVKQALPLVLVSLRWYEFQYGSKRLVIFYLS